MLLLTLFACETNALRTLDTCDTTIAAEAPDFFQLYRCVDVTVTGDEVALASIGLPPHPSPYYPETSENWEAFDDRGGDWFQNPNEIAQQAITVTVPLEPVAKGLTITDAMVDLSAGTSDDEYNGGNVGIALDGVMLFAAMAAPGDDIAEEKYTFDLWEGHPQNTGVYHHHSANPGGLAVLEAAGWTTSTVPGEAEIELYGIMCDGTVVLGCTELDGSAPAADLDAQAGHVHDLVNTDGDTWFTERYHTHMCDALSAHVYTPEIQYYEGCAAL